MTPVVITLTLPLERFGLIPFLARCSPRSVTSLGSRHDGMSVQKSKPVVKEKARVVLGREIHSVGSCVFQNVTTLVRVSSVAPAHNIEDVPSFALYLVMRRLFRLLPPDSIAVIRKWAGMGVRGSIGKQAFANCTGLIRKSSCLCMPNSLHCVPCSIGLPTLFAANVWARLPHSRTEQLHACRFVSYRFTKCLDDPHIIPLGFCTVFCRFIRCSHDCCLFWDPGADLPPMVATIEEAAFEHCTALTTVKLPPGLKVSALSLRRECRAVNPTSFILPAPNSAWVSALAT